VSRKNGYDDESRDANVVWGERNVMKIEPIAKETLGYQPRQARRLLLLLHPSNV
jgi:hypothetical protein